MATHHADVSVSTLAPAPGILREGRAEPPVPTSEGASLRAHAVVAISSLVPVPDVRLLRETDATDVILAAGQDRPSIRVGSSAYVDHDSLDTIGGRVRAVPAPSAGPRR